MEHAVSAINPVPEAPAEQQLQLGPNSGGNSPIRVLRIVTGLAIFTSLVGIGLGVYELTKPATATTAQLAALHHQVSRLQSRLASDGSEITSLHTDVATLQSSATSGQVLKLQKTVSSLTNCVPQLQTEIGGLGINWSINGLNTSNDSFSITNPTIISSDCSRTLYGG
jgi:hypothetical protein